MCWMSNSKPEQLVAKEDITVYKVVQVYPNNEILSYFNDFPYKLGETYNTSIGIENFYHADYSYNSFYFIEQGFHSYNYHLEIGSDPFLPTPIVNDNNKIRYYGEGIYEMLCIIPKGTKYYINSIGDLVSASIKPITLSTKELNDLKQGEHFEYGKKVKH